MKPESKQPKKDQPENKDEKPTTKNKKADIKDGAVRAIKADLFAYVFSEEDALVELYSATGNEITVEEIEYIDLDELLQRTGRYKDASFRTIDWKLIVFNEQQSTSNPNIPYRTLEYAVDTIRSLRVLDNMVESESGQNIYGTKLIEYPDVKFYVAYNGKKELSNEEKNLIVTLGDITVRATVVDIRFDKLSEKYKSSQSKLGGYAFFVKRFEEHKADGKTPYNAYDLAVQESLANNYLTEIWNKKECVDVFKNVYSVEDEIRQEGREEGIEIGEVNLATKLLDLIKKGVDPAEYLQSIANKGQKTEVVQG